MEARRTAKRYVLLIADSELSKKEVAELGAVLEGRLGKVKVFEVKGNPRAVVVRTTNASAPLLRGEGRPLVAGGKRLEPVLTSGAIGKLKKRAEEAAANGQVHE